jgi:hypothetical protein
MKKCFFEKNENVNKFLEENLTETSSKFDFAVKLASSHLKKNLIPLDIILKPINHLAERLITLNGLYDFTDFQISGFKILHLADNDFLLPKLRDVYSKRVLLPYFSFTNNFPIFEAAVQDHRGLKNLGQTCFLNSTLQQFFFLSPIRKIVFENDKTDSFSKELKELFLDLKYSKFNYANPSKLF